jgi:hypothetical protein
MPGTAITVRVLMFIGGAFGLLFAGLPLLVGLGLLADPETAQEALLEAQDSDLCVARRSSPPSWGHGRSHAR